MKNFNEINWHDAILKSINIIRNEKDNIELKVYINDRNMNITFYDCYKFIADMNFGILIPDTIRFAEKLNFETEECFNIKKVWENLGIDLGQLQEFLIETNSTNSKLRIFSKGVTIIDS